MSAADGIVLPKPQVPKTLGILNIIFGSLLVLFGMCTVGVQMAAPMFRTFAEKMASQANQASTARHQASLKSLEDAEKAEPDAEKKAVIKAQRDTLAASPPATPIQPDLSSLDQLNNPTIRNATLIDKGTGLIMNIALIVAGVGLVRLREWGRSFGVKLAAVQLVRLVLILAGYMVIVVPVQKVENERIITRLEDQIKAGTAPPTATNTVQMTKAMMPLAPVFVVVYYAVASVYPAISLWLLGTAGARAACRGGKSGKPDGFYDLPGAP